MVEDVSADNEDCCRIGNQKKFQGLLVSMGPTATLGRSAKNVYAKTVQAGSPSNSSKAPWAQMR